MAKEKAKLASSKPASAKWLENAMRSIGVSAKAVMKDELPNLYDTVETGANASKTIISTLRRNANSSNRIQQQLQNNKYIKFAQTAYKNALSDIKSGNLNNKEREDQAIGSAFGSGGDDVNALFEDSGFSFGDDGADNVDVNIVNTQDDSATLALSAQLQKHSEAVIKTNQANMNATIAASTAAMINHQQTSSVIISGIENINKSLLQMVQFNTNNMTDFINSAKAYYEKMGSKLASEESEENKKISASDVLKGSSGGLDFSSYKQLVKQQFKSTLDKSTFGMIDGMLTDDMLATLAANPIGGASQFLVKALTPKILTSTMKGIEETYSAFVPALLHKISEWGDSAATGVLGNVKKYIGKIFGLKIERTEKINKTAKLEKGPIPFDGQTKLAITEIITKELREQTSYLGIIANHFDKENSKNAKENAEVFDSKTGKYITVSQVTDNIIGNINDAVVGAMNTTKFGKSLRGYKENFSDKNQIEAFDNALDEFMVRLERLGDIKLGPDALDAEDSEYNKLLGSLTSSDDVKKLVDNAVRNMVANDKDAATASSIAMLTAKDKRNKAIKDIETNYAEYNLLAARGLDDKSLDELQDNYFKNRPKKDAAKIESAKTEDPKNPLKGLFGSDDKKDSTSGSNSTIGKFLTRAKDGFQKFAFNIIHGSGSDAVDSMASMMKDNFTLLWDKFNDSFLTPAKKTLFGSKNKDTGFSEGGIFSSVTNRFKDTAGIIKQYVTGKEYKDSTGKVHKLKEGETSLVDNFKRIGGQVKDKVLETLLGKKLKDENGNELAEREGGLLSGFQKSIKNGFQGWKDALFGKKEDNADQQKKAQTKILETIKQRLPDAAMGGAIGVGVGVMAGGSLLGTLIGGPIGGAAMGTAIGFMAKSEKFQDFLFGAKDPNTKERTGGLISKKLQDYFTKNKDTAIVGSSVGAIGGALTGGGVLGTLVGGPIAGALVGMGTSLFLKSEKFQNFMFGEADENGKRSGGLWSKISNKISEFGKKNGDPNTGKLGGMMAIGAAGGGLLGSLVGGPIVGSVLGLGASILAQKDNFHEWFFGKTDENGNKKEGVLGKFKNMLTVNVFRPVSNMFKDIGSDFKTFLRYDVLERLKISMEPIADTVSNAFHKITKSTVETIGNVGNYIKENFLDNFIANTGKLFAPLTKAVTSITKGVYSFGKAIVATPFKLLSALTSPIARTVGNVVTGFAKTAFKGLNFFIVKPIKNLVLKPLAAVTKGLAKVVAAPFKLLGNVATKLTNFISGGIDHLAAFTKKLGEHIKDSVANSFIGRFFKRKKEEAKEFAQHVKDAAIQFISPLTDFVKVTIKSVGQHIKDSVSSGFKKLLGGVGNFFKNLFGGKKDKDKDPNKPKKESTLARIWRETAPGQRTDLPTTIDPNMSQSQKRRTLTEIIKEENAKNKKAAEERRQLERNEKLIAKYTGNQRADFTEENKALAEYEAKKKGITIDWGNVETRKTTEDKVLKAQTSTSENTKDIAETTKLIADFIMGRTQKDPEVVKQEQAALGEAVGEAIAKRDAEIADKKLNAETNAEKKEAARLERDQTEARQKESKQRQEEMTKNLAGKDESGISFFQGMKANWANLTGYWKGLAAAKKAAKEEKKLKEASKLEPGESIPVADLEPGDPASDAIIEQHTGEGYAKGTLNSKSGIASVAELIKFPNKKIKRVGKNGPEFMNLPGGSQVYPMDGETAIPVVLVDVAKGASSNLAESIANESTDAKLDAKHHAREEERRKDELRASTLASEARARLDEAIEDGKTHKELLAEDKATELAKEQLEEQKKSNEIQEKHAFNWSSIFGKKGLIGAGLLLAVPLIIKAWPVIKSIGEGIGNFISGVASMFGWTNKNGALGDGDTMGDKLVENSNRITSLVNPNQSIGQNIKGFVLNEDGQVDHMTDANAKLLVSGTAHAMTKGGKFVAKHVDDIAKGAKVVGKVGSKATAGISKAGSKLAGTKVGKVATTAVSKAGSAVKSGGAKIVDAASNLLKPVLESVTKWIDDLLEAVGKKMGKKIGSSVLSNTMKNMSNIVTKYFGKISPKIASIFTKNGAIAASNAIAGLGIAIKATEITLSAINGASGAARLFQVDQDHVDGKMTVISTLIGAAKGTMIGSIIDVVNELVASVTGVDFLSEIATTIYGVWAGEEKSEALKTAKEAFKNDYLAYQDKELTKQYETAKKAGLIGEDLSYEDYKKGVQDGTYKAKYDSFVDYNNKEHKTLGAKIGDSIGKGAKWVGKKIGDGWSSVFGKNEKYLEDSNGNKYYDNGDGTYQVRNAKGDDLGFISKEALPADTTEKKDRKQGALEKAFTNMKKSVSTSASKFANVFASKKGTVYYDKTDGSFYDEKGTHYSTDGSRIGGDISQEDLQIMIKTGMVEPGEGTIKSVFKDKGIIGGVKELNRGLTGGINKFIEGANSLSKSITTKVSDTFTKIADLSINGKKKAINFVLGKKTGGYFDSETGTYYVSNGSTFDQYNGNGDKIQSDIPADEIQPSIETGKFTFDPDFKIDTKFSTALKSLSTVREETFKNVKDLAVNCFTSINDGATKLFTNINSEGLIGGIKKSVTTSSTSVWFDSLGNYYKANGDTYDYYNANNDLLESGVAADVVEAKKLRSELTLGEITEKSSAKNAIDNIKSAVSNAWNTAKDTVSNAWNAVTSWVTGNSNTTETNPGDASINTTPETTTSDTTSSDATVADASTTTESKGVIGSVVSFFKGLFGGKGGPSNSPASYKDIMSKYTVTSNYGNRMIDGKPELHSGIDFSNALNSPVNSFTSGTVYKVVSGATPNSGNLNSTDGGGFGNHVIIKDDNGNYHYYAHMNSTSVNQGDTVKVGDKLGLLGHTGRSTGPHLHYEVRKNPNMSGTADNTFNPTAYLDGTSTSGTSTSSGSSIGNLFDKLAGFISEFSNRAIKGITTGVWDSNYDNYFANNAESGISASTNYTADTSSYVKINSTEGAKKIWNHYRSLGIPNATVAGMLGNIHAESGLNPRNLQNSYEKSLGYTDDSYTTAIDSGKYNNFVHDSAGYGLVQWTYHSLKKALLDYAKKKGSSIGDLDMQLDFLAKQLSEDYPSTWKKMLNASSPEEASEIMLREFEKPAVLNTATRAGYAKQYYDTLSSKNMGGASIKHRVVKTKNDINDVYGGPIIDSLNYTRNAVKEYTNANNANKFISSNENNIVEKAINKIITLLEAISGNTSSTSSKLDMLENLKKANITKGGDTTNIINNNGPKNPVSNDSSNQITGKKVSRNQKVAERIALGL